MLNDLWKFNLTTGWWTWVGGSSSINQLGSYGSLGVAAVGNVPGARAVQSMVIDSASRVMYVVGGLGYGAGQGFGASGSWSNT